MAIATKKRPAKTKRHAAHHKQTKPYVKAYYPFLPLVAISAIAALLTFATPSNGVLGSHADLSNTGLLSQTNAARQENNLPQLTENSELDQAAKAKATDMATRDYWAHDSPDGRTPWTFIAASGYQYSIAGENLAYGFNNADATIDAWLHSPEHRENLLGKSYSNVGFGVAQSPDYQHKGPQTIVVALYAQPSGAVASFNFTVDKNGSVKGAQTQTDTKLVSRLQTATGWNPWTTTLLSALAGAALTLLLIRYGIALRKIVLRGEYFLIHHPVFDTVLVGVIVLGFILTRASGFIR